MMRKRRNRALAAVGIGAIAVLGFAAPAMAAPAAGDIDPDETGSVTLHKFEGSPWAGAANDGTAQTAPAGAEPLNGVTFALCQVDGLDVLEPTDWDAITALNAAVVATGELPDGTVCTPVSSKVTGTDGIAADDGTAQWTGLELGVYFVTETGAPAAVVEHTAPFLVTVPLPHSATGDWLYDVHVYPKNAVATVEKTVADPATLGLGSAVPWTVTMTVPEIQGSDALESLVITDTLDARLQFVPGSLSVEVNGATLAPEDYVVTPPPAAPATGGLLKIEFLDEDDTVTVAYGDTIEVTFQTKVMALSPNGTIPNGVEGWVNNPTLTGTPTVENPTDPTTQWGSMDIIKESGNSPEPSLSRPRLSGAVFQVFATADAADACVAQRWKTPQEACADAVQVTTGATPVDTFTTDEDGYVVIPGLYVGKDNTPTSRDYWVVEITAPAGYILSDEAKKVTIWTNQGANPMVHMTWVNLQQPPSTLPLTGGAGAGALTLLAVALGAGGVLLLVSRRRKARHEA